MVAKHNHFVHWTFLVLFSVVALSALLNQLKFAYSDNEDLNHKDWEQEERWVVSVAAISLFLSVFACAFHVVMDDFIASNIEIGMIVVVLAMWSAGLPKLMDGKEFFALAQDIDFSGNIQPTRPMLVNANLFFSSWGALIMSLYMALHRFEAYAKREDDKFMYKWAGLGFAGLVVLCDSARFFKDLSCSDLDDNETCNRTIFGIVLGAVTFIFGGTSALVTLEPYLSNLAAGVFVVAWCFGVAYLTFNEGPALQVGTQYFAIWAALMFALYMAAPGFFELFVKEEEATSEDAAAGTKDVPAAGDKNGEEAEEEEVGTGETA